MMSLSSTPILQNYFSRELNLYLNFSSQVVEVFFFVLFCIFFFFFFFFLGKRNNRLEIIMIIGLCDVHK